MLCRPGRFIFPRRGWPFSAGTNHEKNIFCLPFFPPTFSFQVLRPPAPARHQLPQEKVRPHQPAAPQEEAQVRTFFVHCLRGGVAALLPPFKPPSKKPCAFPFFFLLCVRKEVCARATSGCCVCKRVPSPFRVFFRIMTSVVCLDCFYKTLLLSLARSLSAQSSTN
jgi:hypothetical protein